MVFIFVIVGCKEPQINTGDPNNPNNPVITAKYAVEFRGEWIRMDTGDRWYINGDSIRVNDAASSLDVTLEKTSDNVISAQAGNQRYILFAARIANAGFNAQIVLLDEPASPAGRSSQGTTGQKPPVRIINPEQPDQEIIVEPDPETDEINVIGVIPGDKIVIIPDDSEWDDINVELTPGFGEDQNLGVIPLTHGDNFKVSLVADSSGSDIYADGTPRTYTFELENIGSTICGETRLEISWDSEDFSLVSGSVGQDYTNIAPGEKKPLNLTLASLPIETETKNKEFKIKIQNYDSRTMTIRTWDDTASVNYYKAPVPFNFRSEKQVQGVIKSKKGKSYYFRTQGSAGNFTTTVNVPWSDEEYTIAFLGATIESGSATKYSFAIDDQPPSDWNEVNIWDFLSTYKPRNASEETAPDIDLSKGDRAFMGYLAGDSVDYYKVKLGALDEIRHRTVIFDTNGAAGTVPQAITLDYGTVMQLPGQGDMNKSGYVFTGWNTNSSGTGNHYDPDSSYIITGDVTLYAIWELAYYVIYNENGGSGIMEPSIIIIDKPQNLRVINFFRTGYTFSGWADSAFGPVAYIDEESVINLTTISGAEITLYAVWSANTYTVVYNENGGSGIMENSSFTYDTWQELRKNTFTSTDYIFAGWAVSASELVKYTDEESVRNLTATAGAEVTLYAIWVHSYTVVYNANGGSGNMENSSFVYGVEQTLRANMFTRTGYTFTGWAESESGMVVYEDQQSVNNLTTTAGATVTLYAIWAGNTYTVKYDNNDGEGSMSNSSHTYGTPQNLRTNIFTKPGYAFTGWALSSSGPVVYTDEQSVSNLTANAGVTVTLYAVWVQSYTVAYDVNGGSGNMEISIYVYGVLQALRKNDFTRFGYIFAGWAESASGTVVYTDQQSVRDLTTIAGHVITLYAAWTPVYTVAYNANGGSGSMENSAFTYGVPGNLRTNTFTYSGYVFVGWAVSASGSVVYTDGQSVSNLTSTAGATVPLFAVWASLIPVNGLAAQLSWLQTFAVSNVDYLVEVSANESIGPTTLSYSG